MAELLTGTVTFLFTDAAAAGRPRATVQSAAQLLAKK